MTRTVARRRHTQGFGKADDADLVNLDGSPNLDDPRVVGALDFAYSGTARSLRSC